jgi:hypothetical protein
MAIETASPFATAALTDRVRPSCLGIVLGVDSSQVTVARSAVIPAVLMRE